LLACQPLDGLAVKDSELPPPLEPRQAALEIVVEQIPIGGLMASLFAAGIGMASAGVDQADQAPDDGATMGADPADLFANPLIMQALNDANAITVKINRLALTAAGSGLDASGKLKVDTNAASGVTGALQMQLRGLDAVLEFANSQAQNGAAPEGDASGIGEMAGMLLFLKGLGKPETGDDGVITYDYKIAFPKDGAPTVNGTSLDAMMGGGAPLEGEPSD